MKVYLVFLFLLAAAYYSHAQEKHKNSSIKAMIIQEIMKKVSNITLNSLSKVPDDKKDMVLNKIEQKLKKTAAGLTDGQKYVKIIMEEFKNKAFNMTGQEKKKEAKKKAIIKQQNSEEEDFEQEKNVLRSSLDDVKKHGSTETEKRISNRKIFDNQTKEQIIKDISHKIESMAKGYLRQSQTFEQKQKIFERIRKRIVESSKRKHMLIHSQHSELKAYTNLITQGLEMSMKKLLSKSRRTADITEAQEQNAVDYNNTHTVNMAHIDDYKTFFAEIWNETSMDPRCDSVVEEICYRIQSLPKLTCGDGKIISLEQLCDGASDCWDAADETNCTTQAIEKSRQAGGLMSDMDQSFAGECFQPVIQNTMFSQQHRIVRDMLDEQLKLLEKYQALKTGTPSVDEDTDDDDIFIKNLVYDVAKTVSSLSDVFDANLCTPHDQVYKRNNLTRKFIDLETEDHFKDDGSIDGKTKWFPKSCICKNKFCKITNCDSRCKRICWQKYSLKIWQCPSITGDKSISLDLICDGKLDCFDESDETSCTSDSSITKYEANGMYKDMLEILSLKALSVEYEHSRNKITAQTGLVRQLQKLTTNSYVDVHAIKIVREEYFKTLENIYGDMLQNSNLAELDDIYDFLHEMHERMIKALKFSNTGNEHVVAPAGCYCNNGTCALVRCSKKCIKTCQIEPLLTKYPCNDNTSVHLKAVCDGKNDCPNEEDENDCHKEVCRAHHLVLLRHNLQRGGMSLKGSALGEILDGWKSKVMSSLIIAQGSERPNHKMLEDIVIKVLRDLVTTYASMEETKRTSPDFIINQFVNMSDIVKKTLKYCDK